MDLIAELQKAIRRDKRSLFQLARDADIPYPGLHRFMHGKRTGINIVTVGKLMTALGLKLTRKGRK